MGMFDWVITTRKLPVQKANRLAFQTKDLESNLDIVYLDADGGAWIYTWASDYQDCVPMPDTEFTFAAYMGNEVYNWLEFKVTVKDGFCQYLRPSENSTFQRPYVDGSVLHEGERTRQKLFEQIGVPG